MTETWIEKRTKLSQWGPLVKSGVVCASTSAAYSGKFPFRIEPEAAELAEFFPDVNNRGDVAISADCLEALGDPDLSETQLRDKIYVELTTRQGITVPDGCKNSDTDDKFKELDLNNLFGDIAKYLGLETDDNVKMKRFEQALVVTSTSKPNLSSFLSGKDFKEGECKHGKDYSQSNSSGQGFLYLFAFMYWLRVKQGLPVNMVYGFGICGHKCKDHKTAEAGTPGEYSIGLFKLTAPDDLGDVYTAQEYWTPLCKTNDSTAFELLVQFLKNGNHSNFAETEVTKLKRDVKDRAPCLFALPREYWKDTDNRRLVVNGTYAMVFQLHSLAEVSNMSIALANKCGKLDWVDDVLNPWVSSQVQANQTYYLKVRTKDMSPHFEPSPFPLTWLLLAGKNAEFKMTYLLPPIFDDESLAVVMNDRGRRPDEKSFSNLKALQSSFRDLKKHTEALDKKWKHGDALYHNLTVTFSDDEMKDHPALHLIDYDEGDLPGLIPERQPETENTKEGGAWILELMYPNALRRMKNVWYTRVQLAATLIRLILLLDEEQVADKYQRQYERLANAAESAAKKLAQAKQAPKQLPPALEMVLKSLEQEVETLLDMD